MLSVEAGRLLSKECKSHKARDQQDRTENKGYSGFWSTLVYLCTLCLTEVGYDV